jgi:hypothetical protein
MKHKMRERQRVDFLPPPPPAPGEQGRRQASSFACHRLPANRRTLSDATSKMGAVDTSTYPPKSQARGGRVANVVPTPPPAVQRAIGVKNTTPPAPHDRSGRNIGVEDSSPPSPTVQDCSGCARNCAHRWAMRHAGNGTQRATQSVPTTTFPHGDTGFRSPPPDFTQATTALPSSPSLLSHDEVEDPPTPPPPLAHAVNNKGNEAVGVSHDGALDGFCIVEGRGGQQPPTRCENAFHMGDTAATLPLILAKMAAPLKTSNPYEILRNTLSGAKSSPLQIPPALAPTAAITLCDIVEDGLEEMFGDMADSPADDTHFWLREIF